MKKSIFICLLLSLILIPVMLNGAEVVFLAPSSFEAFDHANYHSLTSECIFFDDDFSRANIDYTAQLQLPEGAKISSYVVFYMDNQTDTELSVKLVRQNRYDGTQNTIITEWTSTNSSGTHRTYKNTNVNYQYNKILNNACTYHVNISFKAASGGTSPYDYQNLKLYAVKVFYMPPTT